MIEKNINLVRASTSKSTKKFKYENVIIGSGYWHIHKGYLFIQYCWETHAMHVGDIKADETKNLKMQIQIPLK